jgi:hypothetical protein
MVGRTGPLEGSGAEVRGHLLQSLSHAAAQSLNWVGSLLHLLRAPGVPSTKPASWE